MTLTANQIVKLTDAAGRDIGSLAVERVEGDLLLGTFTPGTDFPAVRDIFNGFAEAVEQAALGGRYLRPPNRCLRHSATPVSRQSLLAMFRSTLTARRRAESLRYSPQRAGTPA